MKKIFLVLIAGIMLIGVNVFADDVSIDQDGNITTGLSSSGNLEVIGSSGEDGIVGSTSGTGASGVLGKNTTYNNLGILGGYFDTSDVGVYGYSSSGYAGYFQGNARITGNLTLEGSLIGYNEIDPVFSIWDMSTGISIIESQITDLNHFTTGDETDPVFSASPSFGITSGLISNWNTAYGWGNHSSAGYDTTDDAWTGTGNVSTTSGNVGIGTTASLTDRLIIDVADGSSENSATRSNIERTTGDNYAVVGSASGSGATQNVGLYGWASGATTNWGLWVDEGDAKIDYDILLSGDLLLSGEILSQSGDGTHIYIVQIL